jgi:hypothetical protein
MADVTTAVILSPSGRTIKVVSDDQAIVDAKLAVMIGTLDTEKTSADVETPGTLQGSTGSYDDAVLVCLKAGETFNVQMQNVATTHKLTGTKVGAINPGDTAIQAVCAAYGATLVSGRYTRG